MNTAKGTYSPATLVILAGDLFFFLLFAWIGRAAHGHEISFVGLVETAAPFALAWLAVGALMGTFTSRAFQSAGKAVKMAFVTWLIAAPIGLIARAVTLGTGIPWTFALITFVTNALFLLIWRSLFAGVIRRMARSSLPRH